MLDMIRHIDSRDAAGLLARTAMALASLRIGGLPPDLVLENEDRLRELIVSEIRKRLGIRKNSNSEASIRAIEAELDKELEQIAEPVDFEASKKRLKQSKFPGFEEEKEVFDFARTEYISPPFPTNISELESDRSQSLFGKFTRVPEIPGRIQNFIDSGAANQNKIDKIVDDFGLQILEMILKQIDLLKITDLENYHALTLIDIYGNRMNRSEIEENSIYSRIIDMDILNIDIMNILIRNEYIKLDKNIISFPFLISDKAEKFYSNINEIYRSKILKKNSSVLTDRRASTIDHLTGCLRNLLEYRFSASA